MPGIDNEGAWALPLPVRSTRLVGSFRDIGRALAETQDWSGVLAEPVGHSGLAEECERLARRLHPPTAEKFDGIVEALGIEPERLRPWYFVRGAAVGCMTFAWEQEEPVIGRAYHWVHEAAKWCELRIVRPLGKLGYVTYTHNACGAPDGINEAGLCAFLASMPPAPATAPGLPWHGLMDWVLSEAETTDQAAKIMEEAPHLRAFVYFLADAHGGMRVVEAFPDGVHTRGPEDGLLIGTNYSIARRVPREHESRQRRARECLRGLGPGMTQAKARATLASHDGPFCVGRHVGPGGEAELRDADWYTLWAMVSEPRKRRLSLCPGQPCRTDWIELDVRDLMQGESLEHA